MARLLTSVACLALVSCLGPEVRAAEAIAWQPWSAAVFADAKRQHKFVLLDLEAVWCHWCHVMDKETYADPAVIALINSRYIAVRADQDSRPDLSNRYEDYGWPATVVFAADGSEIVRRQGYLPPSEMTSVLKAIIADPSPGPSVTGSTTTGTAGPADTPTLRKTFDAGYDPKLGGWSSEHKFLDWDNTEYLLMRGVGGDPQAAARARQVLAGELKLVDPVWGGVYQYSIGDWDHPHFEKLIQMQAENMRIFALAFAINHDPACLAAARKIHDYVGAFLTSPEGAVYTSQDADLVDGEAPEPYYKLDDAGRRRLGLPRVDTHLYARANGWWIEALCRFYAVTGDTALRAEAEHAARWVLAHRAVPGGGFAHGENRGGALYLGDTLFMGRAFLALAEVTADPAWRVRSEQAADFIRSHFQSPEAADGLATATKSPGDSYQPRPEYDENVALARWANLLAHETNRAGDHALAASALAFARGHATARFAYVGGYLLAQGEAAADPLHVVVVGPRADAGAQSLFLTALGAPFPYRQVEWLDPSVSAAGVYPKLGQAAAFLCANQACSAPVYTRADLARLLTRVRPP